MKHYMHTQDAIDAFKATDPGKREMQAVIIDEKPVVLMATPMAEDEFYDKLEPLVNLIKSLGIEFTDSAWHELNQAVLEHLFENHFLTMYLQTEF